MIRASVLLLCVLLCVAAAVAAAPSPAATQECNSCEKAIADLQKSAPSNLTLQEVCVWWLYFSLTWFSFGSENWSVWVPRLRYPQGSVVGLVDDARKRMVCVECSEKQSSNGGALYLSSQVESKLITTVCGLCKAVNGCNQTGTPECEKAVRDIAPDVLKVLNGTETPVSALFPQQTRRRNNKYVFYTTKTRRRRRASPPLAERAQNPNKHFHATIQLVVFVVRFAPDCLLSAGEC
jgi:hypothetical protein